MLKGIKNILGNNSDKLEELIIDWLKKNNFKIGSRLPSQNEFVKIFSCSKTTVHKAMQGLVQKGIVIRHIGKGTFLKQIPNGDVFSQKNYIMDSPISLNSEICNKKFKILVLSIFDREKPPSDSPAYEILSEAEDEIRRLSTNSKILLKGIFNLESLISEVTHFMPDGVIIDWVNTSGQIKPLAAELILRKRSIPVIHCMHSCNNENSLNHVITLDNCKISKLALEYLFDNGHKNILLATAFSDHSFEKVRVESAFDIAETLGIKLFAPDRLFKDYPKITNFFVQGKNIFDFFKSLKNDITAIYSINDKIAISFIKEAQKEGIRIPEDLSVIGVDNEINIHLNANINLTSIDPCRAKVGRTAAKRIIEILLGFNNDINSQVYRISPLLIERDTVRNLKHK